MAALLLSLVAACTPHLYSDGADDTGAWTPPTNTWPSSTDVPADLEGEGFSEGQVTPEIRLMDQHGDEVSLWQFYGMVVALDMSTGWCGPCAALADEVDEVWHAYEDQGFIYVTMLPEDSQGQVPEQSDLEKWATDHSITAPILADDEGWSYEIVPSRAWPQVMIIGRDLRVEVDQVSPVEDSAIRAAIEAAL